MWRVGWGWDEGAGSGWVGLCVGWVRVKVFCGGLGGWGLPVFMAIFLSLYFPSLFCSINRPWTDVCSIASITGNVH